MPKAVVTAAFAIAAILVAVMAGVRGTTASFSDRATSNGNTFAAGTLVMNLSASPGCDGRHYGGESGNPGADGNTGCSNGGALTWSGGAAMTPGTQATGSIVVQNTGSLAGTLSSPSAMIVSSDPVNCPATSSNFTLMAGAFPAALAASSGSTVPFAATVPNTSANGCQGVTFTATIPFHLDGPGSPGFTDSAVSTGNTLTMATLLAPLSVTATPTGSSSASVTWAPASGDHAAGYDLFRHTGDCTGWTPMASEQLPGPATSPYSDSALAANTQYCYAVRGVNQNWVSDFTFGGGITSATPPPTRLYISGLLNVGDLVSTGSLRTTPDVGALAVLLPGTWPSEQPYAVPPGATWTLNVDTILGSLLLSGGLKADVWLGAASSCGSVPNVDAANYIAGGTKVMPLLALNQHITLALTNNSAFEGGTGRVCLRLSSTGLISLSVATSPNSYLAFAP